MNQVDENRVDARRLRQAQILVMSSLAVGVTLFAVVAYWLRRGETPVAVSPLPEIWAFATAVACLIAYILWTRLVRPQIPAIGFRTETDGPSLARLNTGLLVCMALVEGMSLFGIVTHLVGGGPLPALTSVVLIWLALVLLWPRAGWYGLR